MHNSFLVIPRSPCSTDSTTFRLPESRITTASPNFTEELDEDEMFVDEFVKASEVHPVVSRGFQGGFQVCM